MATNCSRSLSPSRWPRPAGCNPAQERTKPMKTKLHWLAAAALALAAGGTAHAQQAGRWIAQIGVTNIAPDVDSGDLTAPSLPGTKVDIKSDTQLSGGIVYMVTDHWAV